MVRQPPLPVGQLLGRPQLGQQPVGAERSAQVASGTDGQCRSHGHNHAKTDVAKERYRNRHEVYLSLLVKPTDHRKPFQPVMKAKAGWWLPDPARPPQDQAVVDNGDAPPSAAVSLSLRADHGSRAARRLAALPAGRQGSAATDCCMAQMRHVNLAGTD